MQAGIGFAALLTYFLLYVGMPETSHPGTRGVDKQFGGEFKWVWLNPFRCLWYMRSPNLFALVSSPRQSVVSSVVCDADSCRNDACQTFVGATTLFSEFGTNFLADTDKPVTRL